MRYTNHFSHRFIAALSLKYRIPATLRRLLRTNLRRYQIDDNFIIKSTVHNEISIAFIDQGKVQQAVNSETGPICLEVIEESEFYLPQVYEHSGIQFQSLGNTEIVYLKGTFFKRYQSLFSVLHSIDEELRENEIRKIGNMVNMLSRPVLSQSEA